MRYLDAENQQPWALNALGRPQARLTSRIEDVALVNTSARMSILHRYDPVGGL
jgi:hypothetical protein